KVLLVEDNDVNREVALGMLETMNCVIACAADGRQALEMIEKNYFDVVLMDCQMPVMDGFEATREIRRIEASSVNARHLPIIAITANAMKGDRERCLEQGMDDYVPKPVRLDTLRAALERYHAGECARKSAKVEASAPPAAEGPRKSVFDYDSALETACGKPE